MIDPSWLILSVLLVDTFVLGAILYWVSKR